MAPLKVWSKFTATNKAGKTLKLRTVEIPGPMDDNLIDLYINYFVKEETNFKAAGVPQSEEALLEVKEYMKSILLEEKLNIVICCVDNNDDEINEIVGVSVMAFTTREQYLDLKVEPKSEELKKALEMYLTINSMYIELNEFPQDLFFMDRCIFVLPDYRGFGIARELLRVRRLVCKEFEVPVHGAWMTSYGTQKAAERDGWETAYEFNYKEFGKQLGVTIDNGPEFCKFMIARIN